jgi:hypothetical protein
VVESFQQHLLRGTRSEIAKAIREILSYGDQLKANEIAVRLEAYDIHISTHKVAGIIHSRMSDVNRTAQDAIRSYEYSLWSLCTNISFKYLF